jgi:hypothetical protein
VSDVYVWNRFGGEKEWEAVRGIYRNPKSEEQRIRATNALGKASYAALTSTTTPSLAVTHSMCPFLEMLR